MEGNTPPSAQRKVTKEDFDHAEAEILKGTE
jgi:hypothetical protein